MPAKNIEPFDFKRLLVGEETPWWFLLEVACRISLIYFILIVTMRLMGKRMAAQMSVSEIAIIVTLGAAVGMPMQSPERGLLPAVVILGVAVLFQRGPSLWSFESRKVEVISQGDVCILVHDGRMLLENMRANVLSRERLFCMLRTQGVEHLGQVRRVYHETSGDFSVFRLKVPRPGLSVMPIYDHEMRREELTEEGFVACFSCGNVVKGETTPGQPCGYCGHREWTEAFNSVSTVEAAS